MSKVETLKELESIDLYAKIDEVFQKALANDDIVFNPDPKVEIIEDRDAGMTWELKIVDGLGKRPNNRPSEPGEKAEVSAEKVAETKKKDPFLKPEPQLTVISDLLGEYRLILNKFPNTADHFLLVTKEFVQQDSLLKPIELQLMNTILRNLNSSAELKKEGTRFFGFFNSGPESGYSQFHKHMQFMKVPVGFPVYQSDLVRGTDFFLPLEQLVTKHPLRNKKASFKHWVLKLKESYKDEEEQESILAMLYMYLVRRALNTEREADITMAQFSYNFLMMDDWMMVVPRRSAKYDGIWQNSLGYMGLFNAKNEEVKAKMEEIGFMKVLEECGFQVEEEEEKIVYNEYSY